MAVFFVCLFVCGGWGLFGCGGFVLLCGFDCFTVYFVGVLFKMVSLGFVRFCCVLFTLVLLFVWVIVVCVVWLFGLLFLVMVMGWMGFVLFVCVGCLLCCLWLHLFLGWLGGLGLLFGCDFVFGLSGLCLVWWILDGGLWCLIWCFGLGFGF